MIRDIIFEKHTGLANALLATGKCTNKGNWIFRIEDTKENMEILQKACDNYTKGTSYKNYKLWFANSTDYKDMITV